MGLRSEKRACGENACLLSITFRYCLVSVGKQSSERNWIT